METTNTKIILLATVLVLALAATPVVSAIDGTATCTKSYIIQLTLSNSGVSEKASQIVYGYSPLPESAPGDLKGRITGADGKTLSEFNLRDPRIQFGDVIMVSEDGKNKSVMRGIRTVEDYADLVVMFPMTVDAKAFNLYDSKGMLLISIDLSKAENRADWNCMPDYGIPSSISKSVPTTLTTSPAPTKSGIGFGGTLTGISVAMIVTLLVLRRRT